MAGVDFDAVDFFRSDELLGDPYPYFDHLRGMCPVQREAHHGVVMVTGYQEATEIFVDARRFSSCNSPSGPFPGFPVPLEGDDVSELIEAYRDQLPVSKEILTADAPRHDLLRSLVARHFTPRRLTEIEPFAVSLADRLIDGFAARGRCELVSEFASPFVTLNTCALLGVPESDHEEILGQILGPHRDRGLGSTSGAIRGEPFAFLHDRFKTYIEDRRVEPRDDVLTRVATATYADGSTPDLMDVVRLSAVLFTAGTGTTAHMLATALRLLCEDPDLQRLLRAEPKRIPNFLEETLRFDGPIKGTFRMSRVATAIGGVEIPAGSTIMLVDGAANRDKRKFDCPNEFHADRADARQHIAFGFGPRVCVGAPFARLEGRVGVERILQRLRAIDISADEHGPRGARRFAYAPSYMARGVLELHLEFESDQEGQS